LKKSDFRTPRNVYKPMLEKSPDVVFLSTLSVSLFLSNLGTRNQETLMIWEEVTKKPWWLMLIWILFNLRSYVDMLRYVWFDKAIW